MKEFIERVTQGIGEEVEITNLNDEIVDLKIEVERLTDVNKSWNSLADRYKVNGDLAFDMIKRRNGEIEELKEELREKDLFIEQLETQVCEWDAILSDMPCDPREG